MNDGDRVIGKTLFKLTHLLSIVIYQKGDTTKDYKQVDGALLAKGISQWKPRVSFPRLMTPSRHGTLKQNGE